MNVALLIAFNGTDFHGWQRQDNAISVQEVLEETLSKIARKNIVVIGCGRTDTGVHARNFYLNADLPKSMVSESNLLYRLNRMLPDDISVKGIYDVEPGFNARFDATERTYRYYVHLEKDPFIKSTSWLLPKPFPDFEQFNKVSKVLLGKQDFTSFSKLHTQTKTNICEITKAHWVSITETQYYFEVTADRFLRNMVRAIVGTFIDTIGETDPVRTMRAIIETKDRQSAGSSVPGKALFLHNIQYPENTLIPRYGSKIT